MCNGYPALRCSNHAKALLNAAEEKLTLVTTWEEQEEAEKLLAHATKVFYTTPVGFKELDLKLSETKDELEKDRLFSLLQEGKMERKNALREYNRVHRVNKEKINNSKILRSSGLPWWVVSSQLNIDLLEKTYDVTLKNVDEGLKHKNNPDENNVFGGEYYIDVKNKSFVITIKDDKYLSVDNRHSLLLYEDIYKSPLSVQDIASNRIKEITSKYADRGDNKAIEYEELLKNQKALLWDTIKGRLRFAGFTHIIVSDPKIGVSNIFTIDDMDSYFKPTLHTELHLRNGTDSITSSSIEKFNTVIKNNFVSSKATLVKSKWLVETDNELTESERILDGFILIPITKNIYEVKKLGNIRGETIRVILTLIGDN